jgi:hypothetical protein
LAPRPGLEPGTCGLTVRRADLQFYSLNQTIIKLLLGLFEAGYTKLWPVLSRWCQ